MFNYNLQDYVFELLGLLIFLNGFFVLTARHTIYSVFFLILVFLLGSFLIIFLNADFLGLVYLVVYVGAIAVLFLFVVMMLDLRTLERSYGWPFYMFTAIFISLFFVFIFLCFVLFFKEKGATDNFDFDFFFKNEDMNDWMLLWFSYFNVEVLGQIIYTHFFLNFILCGFLLLLGMVGAIILALQPFKRNFNLTKSTIRKSMSEQVLREAHLRFFKKNV